MRSKCEKIKPGCVLDLSCSDNSLALSARYVRGESVQCVAFCARRQRRQGRARAGNQRFSFAQSLLNCATFLDEAHLQVDVLAFDRVAKASVGEVGLAHEDDRQGERPLPQVAADWFAEVLFGGGEIEDVVLKLGSGDGGAWGVGGGTAHRPRT